MLAFLIKSRPCRVATLCIGSAAWWGSGLRADAPPSRYVIDMETVADTRTGLVWQRQVEPAPNYAEPTAYCRGLTIAGGGWRAPSTKELLTLVDPTRYDPALDPTAFPGPIANCCRSSDLFTAGNDLPPFTTHMLVSAKTGAMESAGRDDSHAVRCVR